MSLLYKLYQMYNFLRDIVRHVSKWIIHINILRLPITIRMGVLSIILTGVHIGICCLFAGFFTQSLLLNLDIFDITNIDNNDVYERIRTRPIHINKLYTSVMSRSEDITPDETSVQK